MFRDTLSHDTDFHIRNRYTQLVREIQSEQKLTFGLKRRRNDSSSEVPIIHSTSMWLLADPPTKDKSKNSEQSPSEQMKKRRLRDNKDHRSKPGPESGQSGPSMVSTYFEYVS